MFHWLDWMRDPQGGQYYSLCGKRFPRAAYRTDRVANCKVCVQEAANGR